MAEIVRMPKLSDTMTEGVVAEWHKKVGDAVSEGDLLAEIETDKATMEFESFYDGVLLHIGVDKGAAAPVNEILAVIGEKGEDIKALLADAASAAPAVEEEETKVEAVAEATPVVPTPAPVEAAPIVTAPAASTNGSSNGERIFASPLAKKMAAEKGISLAAISGSGENHRIVKRDVENYQPAASGGTVIYAAPTGTESFTDVPNSQMRKAIAKALSASKFSAPHFYLKMEVDMDNAIAARKAINAEEGVKISFNDIVVKACSLALKQHPQVNSQWFEDRMKLNNHVHIGVAVAVEDGLVVPVVRFANEQSLPQIGAAVKDYAVRARNKKLTPQEMEGSTFTISNLGMFGIESFTSIINQPNSAILSVGSIVQKPVVKNGEIVVGNTMKLTLACDHRTVDGATGAQFLQTLKGYIENPVTMLV